MKNIILLFYAVLGGFILAGCGGGGGGVAAPSTEAEQRVITLNGADEVRVLKSVGQIDSSVGEDARTITVVLNTAEYNVLVEILRRYRSSTITVTASTPDPDFCHQNSGGTWQCVEHLESGELITTDISSFGFSYRYKDRLCGSETGIIYTRGNERDAMEIRLLFGDSFAVPYYALNRAGKIMVPSAFGEIYVDVQDNGGLKWNEGKSGRALLPGDRILVAYQGRPSEFLVFQQGAELYGAETHDEIPSLPDYYTCEGRKYLFSDEFAFPENMFRIPDGVTVFSLRGNLRGHMDESAALRLDNFFFTSDSELRDLHLEYRATPFQNDSFALHADGGFRRWGHNDTNAAYLKFTGMRALSPKADIYAQASAGEVRSDLWKDGKLRGFAAGIFYGNVLRHDDSYHLRLEQPFAAEELAHYRFAADARFGEEADYMRFHFWRNLQTGKQGAKAFLTREF